MAFWHIYMGIYGGSPTDTVPAPGLTFTLLYRGAATVALDSGTAAEFDLLYRGAATVALEVTGD